MNITVYCGSAAGNDPAFRDAAAELGKWIAAGGHTLVYGGGNIGLMGIIADTVLAEGGSVVGVIPEFLLIHEKGHKGLHRLEVVDTMTQRKNRMIELGDAFVAMPGGTGTLEEIAEIISLNRLQRIDKPAFFLNINGYYEPLRAMFRRMAEKDFMTEEDVERISFAADVKELSDRFGGFSR